MDGKFYSFFHVEPGLVHLSATVTLQILSSCEFESPFGSRVQTPTSQVVPQENQRNSTAATLRLNELRTVHK